MRPGPDMTIMDPACGTGGFLLAAYEFIGKIGNLDKDQKRFLRTKALRGVEIVDATARLCAMNLLLHGIDGRTSPVEVVDSLTKKPAEMVLTNPPFGKKSSMTVINEEGESSRESLAVYRVVPDNVLFEGGAGERIRERLLHECDEHTLLRLPTGIFYAQGVKANVLFL